MGTKTKRYICIDKWGRGLVAVPLDQIKHTLNNCLFVEQLVALDLSANVSPYIKFRSWKKPYMYIAGSGYRCQGNSKYRNKEKTYQLRQWRPMRNENTNRINAFNKNCKFHFATGKAKQLYQNSQW